MEHGHSAKELNQYEKVFSGHYHSKQENGNVLYTGTPIATTFAEANEQHGIHILDTTTGEIEFVEYTTVKVVSIPYTELDTISNYDPANTRIRVEFPDDLEDETVIDEVQELLHELNFDEIKIKYQGSKVKQLLESVQDAEVQDAEDIDSVVLKFLEQSSSVEGVDSSVMKRYYLKAKEMGEQA
jgi:DNA repair exonuclease SbcCD nuclease subunit